MALNVITNYAANVAHRYLMGSDAAASSSLAKLSSGQRIVSAKDDAAGLAIGSRLNLQVQALKQAATNATQATSMLQVADGALSKIGDILTRMKTLSVQASSGQLGSTERGMIDTEYQNLLSEIDRIANDTTFNGVALLAGTQATTTTVNAQTAAKNYVQANDGFQSVSFDSTVTDTSSTTAVFTFSYNSTTKVLTASNEATGVSQGVNIGAAAIATNATQTVNFSQLGTTVVLNSAFIKTVDVAPAAATTFTSDTTGTIEASTIKLQSIDAALVSTLATNAVVVDASTGGAAAATFTLGALTGTADLTATGTQTVAIGDGTNNVNVTFNVTAAFTTADNAASFTVGDLGTVVLASNQASNTSFTYKIGPGVTVNDVVSVTISQITTNALSLAGGDVLTSPHADTASTAIDNAVDTLNTARSSIGASQNRLQFAADNLSTSIENADAARSGLMDLDIAAEMTMFTSKLVLEQTGISMLAQANRMPENLMRLFQ
jgi:flagellin